MRKDTGFRRSRVLFVVHSGEPVATASAWYDPEVIPEAGTIHFVGVLKEHQGHRLGYWVSLAALHAMRREGRKKGWLQTDDFRLPAIKTYLRLGFGPLLIDENQRDRWRNIFRELKQPELIGQYDEILNGPLWEPNPFQKDPIDYPSRIVHLKRWNQGRPTAQFSDEVVAARGDESLYRPSTLGSAQASVTQVAAGENKPFELVYRAGSHSLNVGSSVVFWMPGQKSLGTVPQDKDPERPGFIECESPDGVSVELLSRGNRPCIGFKIVEGTLTEGDEVRLSIGRKGGFVWKLLASRKEFSVIVDEGFGEPKMRLPEPVVIEVMPLEPDHIDVFLPACFDKKRPLTATVSLRDRYDNRVNHNGPVTIETEEAKRTICLSRGLAEVEVPNSGDAFRVSARCDHLDHEKKSNWCIPAQGLQLFIGDMHVHDFNSPAEGYPADVYQWARDEKHLDFVSVPIQCHHYIDNEKWFLAKHTNEYFLQEGRFVTFLAFEWQHADYGDKVIHFLGGDMPYLPIDAGRYSDPVNLYEALRGTDAFIISHHPGYELHRHVPGTDWEVVETDVDRLVEIWSMHGSSEGSDPQDRPLMHSRRPEGVMEALRKGLRIGLVGGSDTHTGRPGGSLQGPRPYWGGLCAVWAKSLTRRDLFEAFWARRTYALTGARIALRFSVNGAPMGSEIEPDRACKLNAEIWAETSIEKVQLLRNTQVCYEQSPETDHCCIDWVDSRDCEESVFYHCRVKQTDGHLAVCTPVWVG